MPTNDIYPSPYDLEEELETYYMCTGINVAAIDDKGAERSFHGQRMLFCEEYLQSAELAFDCQQAYLKACKQSVGLGEPYFMMCPLNLLHIAVPLMKNNKFCGGLVAGPIIINTPYNQISLGGADEFSHTSNPRLQELAAGIPAVDPIRTSYLGNFLYILSSVQNNAILYKVKETAQLQSQIYEQIQTHKDGTLENGAIRQRERTLHAKVKQGEYAEAKLVLGELLALIYLMEGKNIDATKARCSELSALISRAALDGGAPIKDILAFNMLLTKDLKNLKNTDEISSWMSHALHYYCESITPLFEKETTAEIKKAVQYVNYHYKENIKLTDVANHVHLNPSYFSFLFKKGTGAGFIDYVLDLRIEESKDLLVNTEKSINEIAVAVGFTSQSYFARIFKQRTGRTPGVYRQKYGT
ncbi:MAG: helix-turn-helix domain-containing protein [Negativicutes bacterium]|nr:helix-turn-helix domain-containing protein [Negativicutes bacterium]